MKPTVVRVMANPTASEIGQRGGTWHDTDCRTGLTQALVTFSQGTAKPFHYRSRRKGQKIRFKLLFRLVNERAKKKGTIKKFQATIPWWWKEQVWKL